MYLHNTLSGRKEEFVPLNPERVTMYVCGPTVYSYAHIGNARPAVVFDVLARVLRRRYPRVDYTRNITDIDDKINAAAQAEGVPIRELAERYAAALEQLSARLAEESPAQAAAAKKEATRVRVVLQRKDAANTGSAGVANT